ncbi:MAG TPA: hypothetical protein VNW68_03340 [Candidatus Limnocylindria bacterium]|nr:hypothetical protein [Candidatus Limnocylindria bacterium]
MAIAATTLIAACTGAPAGGSPPASPEQPPAVTSLAPATPASPAGTPVATPPAGPAATPPPAGGPVGQVYTGPLIDALPRVVAGKQLEARVVTGAELEESGMLEGGSAVGMLVEAFGLTASEIEFGIAASEDADVLITASRLPGVDSAALAAAFATAQADARNVENFRVTSIAGRNIWAWETLGIGQYAWINGDIVFFLMGEEQDVAQAIAVMPLPTVALTPTAVDPNAPPTSRAEVDLVLTGGADAGSYSGVAEDGGCSRGATGENSFGLQYSSVEPGVEFSSLQLIVGDAAAAAAGGTDDFSAMVTIGPLFEGTNYEIDPSRGGSGELRIDDQDRTAVVHISGTTADGVGVEATIRCNSIFDFGT